MAFNQKGGKNNFYSRKHTEEWKTEHSKKMKGENNPFYGKHHSLKIRKKMSKNRKGKGKGQIPWNKEKKLPEISDKNHPNWKGDKIGYRGLHMWVELHLGKPKKCEHCEKDGLTGRQIHWANKSGKYLRNLKDWIRLCSSCHGEHDSKSIIKN